MRDRALIVALALTISSVTLILLIIIALSSQNTPNTRLNRSLKENRQTDEPSQPISTPFALKGTIGEAQDPATPLPQLKEPGSQEPGSQEPGTQEPSKPLITLRPTPTVPLELRFHTEVDRRLEEFYLTTLDDQFVNLQSSTLTEEPEQSYYYDPIAHAIIDHQTGQRVSIADRSTGDPQKPPSTKYLLYKKRGENLVLLLTQDMRPVIMVGSNQPLPMRLKRKMSS